MGSEQMKTTRCGTRCGRSLRCFTRRRSRQMATALSLCMILMRASHVLLRLPVSQGPDTRPNKLYVCFPSRGADLPCRTLSVIFKTARTPSRGASAPRARRARRARRVHTTHRSLKRPMGLHSPNNTTRITHLRKAPSAVRHGAADRMWRSGSISSGEESASGPRSSVADAVGEPPRTPSSAPGTGPSPPTSGPLPASRHRSDI